ncbi:penicillin-binding protein activator [Candidatus Bathyarchaeota archaeon]|jgi:branched-chain amino acid transport system substrate-binding protein|nr:penicillin-binding protein activator [Candidatus Bathyarchaeota archaeon]
MATTSRTITIVGIIVALVAGLGIGLFASPTVMPQFASLQTQNSQLQTQIGQLKGQILSGQIKIGILMPITGDLATFGENDREACRIAAKEVNDYWKAVGINATIVLVEEDSATDPNVALTKLQSMAAKGVKFVIGPMSSAEIRQLTSYANTNQIFVMSPSSTAPDLGVSGDFIFRFCPNDTIQGPAIARMMFNKGVRYAVPIFRNDPWGQGLNTTVSVAFSKLGGTVVPGIAYNPTEGATDFSVEVATLATEVQSQLNAHPGQVGVLAIAFEEAVPLTLKARGYPVLWTVPWYGTDGTALSSKMVTDTQSASFSANSTVNWLHPVFAATRSDKYNNLRTKIFTALGREAETYAYASYDGVWEIAYALMAVKKYDADAVRKIMPYITQDYFGASGRVLLNSAGDRAAADYDIWVIYQKNSTTYDWKQYGIYNYATDSITLM